MSSENTQKNFQQGEEECRNLIRESNMYQYQGFWYLDRFIQGVISCQKHFQAQDSDIFLAAVPKSGTTWLKAVIFTLVNRKQFPVAAGNHPLLIHNPQDLVPLLESAFRTSTLQIPDTATSSSLRLFSTHIPYVSLPESVKNNSACKLVYLCRNPKDNFVSLWHFINKLRPQEMGVNPIGEELERFCKGVSPFGPYWEHVLEYWKQSRENPDRIFFLKYEDMKKEPGLHLRLLAEFLGCPFTADEVESGRVEEILKLCSFDHLSSLEVNKNGNLQLSGMKNNAFFRRGEVGDWKNHLSADMVAKFDRVIEEKFHGSGLLLYSSKVSIYAFIASKQSHY